MNRLYINKDFYYNYMRGVKMKEEIDAYSEGLIEELQEDIYDEDYREELLENDEISLEEEAFLKGYEEAY